MNAEKIKALSLHAANVRKMALEAVYSAGAGHPGGYSYILVYGGNECESR